MFFDVLFFNYAVLRHFFTCRFRLSCFFLPLLIGLLIFFPVRNLQELNHPRIFNYVYLFRFFLGRRCFINEYTSYFNLGRYYYGFNMAIYYNCMKTITIALTFLVYELQPLLNIGLTTFYNFSLPEFFNWGLSDLNIFTEIKTNVGLFDLVDCLYFRFYLGNVIGKRLGRVFVECFKINLA